MQLIDTVMFAAYTFICFMGAFVNYNVRYNQWNSNLTFCISFLLMFWINYSTRNMKLDLVKINAYTDIICSMSYYIVYFMCGIPISTIQWIGIFIILIGLILINHQ
jgi:drug/metabolite transporter (DMT)-like permease